MKHRKFVKQLMSLGLDRNGAEMCAVYSRHMREPYANGLARFKGLVQEFEKAVNPSGIYTLHFKAPVYEVSLVASGGYPLGGGQA